MNSQHMCTCPNKVQMSFTLQASAQHAQTYRDHASGMWALGSHRTAGLRDLICKGPYRLRVFVVPQKQHGMRTACLMYGMEKNVIFTRTNASSTEMTVTQLSGGKRDMEFVIASNAPGTCVNNRIVYRYRDIIRRHAPIVHQERGKSHALT